MIAHMIKLIWNRKRKNFLMITGLFISFFVLFLAMVTITYNVSNYVKPLGFDYQNVWRIGLDWKQMEGDEVREKLRQIRLAMDSFPEITNHSLSQSLLFMPGSSSEDGYEYNDQRYICEGLNGGDEFNTLLRIPLVEGRWFDQTDDAALREPVVINRYVKEEIFRDEPAIGKTLVTKHRDGTVDEYTVVGIIGEFRFTGNFSGSKKVIFHRLSLENERYSAFVNSASFIFRILLRVKPDTPVEVEGRLLNTLSSVASGMTITITRLEQSRKSANKTSLILPVIISIISGFLVINVALGLLGMVWYQTNQRRAEIGIRRAAGATGYMIYFQVVGETLVLATFGILIGSFFALQFPLLGLIGFIENTVYYSAWGMSVVIIYLLTALCALYPSFMASRVQPAVALHYE